jgi:hypothetical protein
MQLFMKKYLSTIHQRSPEHKKRFALVVSGCFTLLIFAGWSLVMFGPKPEVAKETSGPVNLAAVAVSQTGVTPFESLSSSLKSAWYSLTHINGQ